MSQSTIDPEFKGWVWRNIYDLLCPECATPGQSDDIPLYSHMSDGMKLVGLVDCRNPECSRHTPEMHDPKVVRDMALSALDQWKL